MKRPTVPDLSDKELGAGKRNVCPLHWTIGCPDTLHEGAEAYLVTLMEDANLIAIHTRYYTLQPRDIQCV